MKSREDKQKEARDKLIQLHKKYLESTIKKQRLETLQKLINRNQKNELLKVRQIDLSKEGQIVSMQTFLLPDNPIKPLNKRSSFSKIPNSQPSSQNQASQTAESGEDTGKVFLPFFFFKIKNNGINFEKSTGFEGSQIVTLYAKSPATHLLFEDFEIIKKLV